jgi:transposase
LIKTLVTQQIELEPAKAHIEEHVRYRYACSQCRAGSSLITTSKPPKPLEKSPFGASVLAWIIAAKFERHLPTYRQQEMLLEPLRIWLSRPLLAELLAGAARELSCPGYGLARRERQKSLMACSRTAPEVERTSIKTCMWATLGHGRVIGEHPTHLGLALQG